MQEKLKEIVSVFIKVAPGDIGPATRIDRGAVQSSILLHRMYARLAQEGIVPQDYSIIKVFGDLTPEDRDVRDMVQSQNVPGAGIFSDEAAHGGSGTAYTRDTADSLGIDIEEIAALPKTADFRKTEFYTLNFSPEEIAYCILQPDPYASFTGLFAVKEAIVKAGGRRRGEPFHTIHIRHSAEGKPLYPGFAISISHTRGMAAAVAARSGSEQTRPAVTLPPVAQTGNKGASARVAWLAVLLGIIALLVALIHRA